MPDSVPHPPPAGDLLFLALAVNFDSCLVYTELQPGGIADINVVAFLQLLCSELRHRSCSSQTPKQMTEREVQSFRESNSGSAAKLSLRVCGKILPNFVAEMGITGTAQLPWKGSSSRGGRGRLASLFPSLVG